MIAIESDVSQWLQAENDRLTVANAVTLAALTDLYQAVDSCVELTPRVMRNAQAAIRMDSNGSVGCTGTRSVVSDHELMQAFEGTNFGGADHRELLCASVFKRLVGYHCGHTITVIMKEMKLIGKTGKPTKRGVLLVRAAYGHLMSRSG